MIKFIKKLFTKKKSQQEAANHYTKEQLERIEDMPTLFDFRLGRASEKWRKYYEKWGNL